MLEVHVLNVDLNKGPGAVSVSGVWPGSDLEGSTQLCLNVSRREAFCHLLTYKLGVLIKLYPRIKH